MSFLKVVEPHPRSSEVIVRCIIENETRSRPFPGQLLVFFYSPCFRASDT